MKDKKCQVIEDYNSPYTEPLFFKKNEEVSIGEKDSEWSGWVWCTNKDKDSRWVPENYVEISGNIGKIKRDYNARELSVRVGEILTIEEEEAEWFWVTNQQGESGWVPIKNVNIL
jgi:uncharacterized protein YgiM (DUF1202 family)